MTVAKAEKYPDVESVLEVIRTREEMGLPLSPGQLNKGKYPDPDLHKAGIRHCGIWQKAVEAAGFVYAEMLGKSRSRYPTAESVIREIKDRQKNGLPLNGSDVGQRPGPYRNSPLYFAAQKHFGNWTAAVEATGFDYSKIRSWMRRKYPDVDSILAEIQRRYEAGLPLNSVGLVKKGEHKDIPLYDCGTEYFGSWRAAIEAAGFEYADIRVRSARRYADADSVVAEIQRRADEGLPLNTTGLLPKGREHQDISLYNCGADYFGSWQAAIEAAGFDYADIRHQPERKYHDAASVVAEIQRRADEGLPLNTAELLPKGREHQDVSLYNCGADYFGSWQAAIEAAGLDYADIRLQPERKYHDAASVVAEIRHRADEGLPLYKAELYCKGRKHKDGSLYDRGVDYFGSWQAALKTAGLNSADFRHRPARRYPDAESVMAEIKRRSMSRLPLNNTELERKGGKYRDNALYKSGLEYFGHWRTVIEAVGLDYADIRFQPERKYHDAASVVAEIKRRHESGLPLNTTALVRKGGDHRDFSLTLWANEYFGSWRAAIEAAGLDYAAIRLRSEAKYPDAGSVVAEIQCRHGAGFPLNNTELVLKGRKHRDYSLYHCGRKHFGSWPAAIEAAGLEYSDITSHPCQGRRYPDGESVVVEIKCRVDAGLSLSCVELCQKENRHKDRALHKSGAEYFGGWEAAIEAAGLDYAIVRGCKTSSRGGRRAKYPDTASVLAEIQRRSKAGLPINTYALTGPSREDAPLHRSGVWFFGSWQAAVEAAGLEYAKIRPRPTRKYPDGASVVAEIKRRADVGLPLNTTALIQKGRKHQDVPLQHFGVEYFGSWRAAVEAAGLDFKTLRPSLPRKYPDGASVAAEIQRRAKAGIPVNATALKEGKHRSKILLNYGREYFGSWPAALEAAGLSYEEVRYKPSRRYPDAASVGAEIKRRHKAGLPLSNTALEKKGNDRDPTLCIRAREYFGGWCAALEATGVEVKREYKRRHLTYPPRRYPDKVSVVAEIKRRAAEGLVLNATGISKGVSNRDNTLYVRGKKYFGTWQAAIEASGFNFHETIRNELDFGRRYPDKASVVAEIQRLAKDGKPLYRSAVLRYGDHALFLSGKEYFGSWPAAIEAVGLDREKARYKPSCRYPDMASVLKGIRHRAEAGLPLSAVSVHKGEHRESLLIASAREYFHTWRQAVATAGIDPDAVRPKKGGK